MKVPFYQDSIGGMCGVFSIVNSYRLVTNAKFEDVEILYREIIEHLSRKRMLRDILLDGMLHKDMTMLINDVVGDRFVEKISNGKWADYSLSAWWKYNQEYLKQDRTAMILGISGKYDHYTCVERMSDKVMFLQDSDGLRNIRRTSCRLPNKSDSTKVIVYPSQCWLIKG